MQIYFNEINLLSNILKYFVRPINVMWYNQNIEIK